jgi:F-box and leucine-rich repeat protein GRR1
MTGCLSINGSFMAGVISRSDSNRLRRALSDNSNCPKGPALRELRLGFCTNLNTEIFIPYYVLQDWSQLRILDLTQCVRLQHSDLMYIISRAPKIRNLVLHKCASITDRAMIPILNLGKNLHFLHLGHCSDITDNMVIQLARHCPRIRYLDLASCNRITDISCIELGIHLERLKRIGLVKCGNITDRGITALVLGPAKINKTLERIHLSYCQRLTLEVTSPLFTDLTT